MDNRKEQPYGPNSPDVEKILREISGLSTDQIKNLSTAWDKDLYEEWEYLSDVVFNSSRAHAVVTANKDAYALTWARSWSEISYVTRENAWGVVSNAILALVVKDEISEEHFNILYGPWKSVMEK